MNLEGLQAVARNVGFIFAIGTYASNFGPGPGYVTWVLLGIAALLGATYVICGALTVPERKNYR